MNKKIKPEINLKVRLKKLLDKVKFEQITASKFSCLSDEVRHKQPLKIGNNLSNGKMKTLGSEPAQPKTRLCHKHFHKFSKTYRTCSKIKTQTVKK